MVGSKSGNKRIMYYERLFGDDNNEVIDVKNNLVHESKI